MDDRDFIYWMNGIFEFGEFDVLKTEQIDQIMENIIEVYDNVKKHGVLNDFDSIRVISFIEGALMYFDEASIEHKVKVTTLIRNEIKEMYCGFRDDNPDSRLPLMKERSVVDNLMYSDFNMDVIPLTPLMVEALKSAGVTHVDLSAEKTASILDEFSKILKGDNNKKKSTSEVSMEYKTSPAEPVAPLGKTDKIFTKDLFDEVSKYLSKPKSTDPLENATIDGAIDDMFEDQQEEATSSLDAIADKIASRA